MAWTSPRTWATGEVVTASQLNAHLRDNLSDLDTRVAALDAQVSALVDAEVASASNSGTGETTLHTATVPGGTLAADGQYVRAFAAGTYGATANTKTARVKVGGTTVATLAQSSSGGGWVVDLTLVRLAASTVLVSGWAATQDGSQFAAVLPVALTLATGSSIDVVTTGQSSAAANDVTARALTLGSVK